MDRDASNADIVRHQQERAFFDMTGQRNVYKYITTENKLAGKYTMFEYLKKSTGVFNGNGMLPEEEVTEMQQRLRVNKGMIWHGFISFNKQNSDKIDSVEKCIRLVKSTFGTFFKEAHLNPKNIDLMCSLHLDKPDHLHIHYIFWEKAPKYKGKDGVNRYRNKGKISMSAIDNMFVRLGLFAAGEKQTLYKSRDEALRELRSLTAIKIALTTDEDIKEGIISLAKALPDTGRLSYGSKEMEPYREKVDSIVRMLLDSNKATRNADLRFYKALQKKHNEILNICGQPVELSSGARNEDEVAENLPKYHHKIDANTIHITEEIQADYMRRQGNLVLDLAKAIKPRIYIYKNKKRKTDDNFLKRRKTILNKQVDKSLTKFIANFGRDSQLLERDFTNRLRDIEMEMKKEQEKEERYRH